MKDRQGDDGKGGGGAVKVEGKKNRREVQGKRRRR